MVKRGTGEIAVSGNPSSELFSRYGKLLARSLANLVRPHDVEDVIQETYIRVFQAAKKQPIRSPQAFMLKTARNIALDRLSLADALNYTATPPTLSRDGEEYTFAELGNEFRDDQTPDLLLESEQHFLELCRAIRALPRQCRRAFVLRKVYGLSQREVAARMGVAEGTIEKHVAKAVLECFDVLQGGCSAPGLR